MSSSVGRDEEEEADDDALRRREEANETKQVPPTAVLIWIFTRVPLVRIHSFHSFYRPQKSGRREMRRY